MLFYMCFYYFCFYLATLELTSIHPHGREAEVDVKPSQRPGTKGPLAADLAAKRFAARRSDGQRTVPLLLHGHATAGLATEAQWQREVLGHGYASAAWKESVCRSFRSEV